MFGVQEGTPTSSELLLFKKPCSRIDRIDRTHTLNTHTSHSARGFYRPTCSGLTTADPICTPCSQICPDGSYKPPCTGVYETTDTKCLNVSRIDRIDRKLLVLLIYHTFECNQAKYAWLSGQVCQIYNVPLFVMQCTIGQCPPNFYRPKCNGSTATSDPSCIPVSWYPFCFFKAQNATQHSI